MIQFASGIGVLIGNIVGAVIRTVLTDEELYAWGWRIPFLSGIVIGFVALSIQLFGQEYNPNAGFYNQQRDSVTVDEPLQPSYGTQVTSCQPSHPLRESFRRENLAALFASALVPMLAGANYYVTFVWCVNGVLMGSPPLCSDDSLLRFLFFRMAVYMETILDPPVKGAFWINACASFFGHSIPSVFMGWISDKYDRVIIMMIGSVGTGLVAPVMIWVISSSQSVPAFFAQFTIGVVSSLFAGPMPAWLGETFAPHVRLTAGSLGYNVAICVSSGFSPLFATALVQRFGPVAPGAIYPFFAALSFIGLFVSKKITRHETENAANGQSLEVDVTNQALFGSLL